MLCMLSIFITDISFLSLNTDVGITANALYKLACAPFVKATFLIGERPKVCTYRATYLSYVNIFFVIHYIYHNKPV